MNDSRILIELLDKKTKLAAMLAPSFPIVFKYPQIVTQLKQLGFTYVAEVAAGAEKTNEQLLALMKANPDKRYITSPCPTLTRMVKKIIPEAEKYLTVGVDSPMAATAKLVREKFPGYKPVFIGPCVMKKIEAKEDLPELEILAITYLELQEVFNHYKIKEPESNQNNQDKFDIVASGPTRIYPIDGGLAKSSGIFELMPDKVRVVSGPDNISAIRDFIVNGKIKLLDILNCPGGCISGPGIKSQLTKEEREKKIYENYSQ